MKNWILICGPDGTLYVRACEANALCAKHTISILYQNLDVSHILVHTPISSDGLFAETQEAYAVVHWNEHTWNEQTDRI